MGVIMEFFKIIILSFLIVIEFAILIFAILSRKPFKTLFLNGLFGILILFGLYFCKKFISVYIPLNQYTVIGTTVFGVPAVIGFLLFNLIFL